MPLSLRAVRRGAVALALCCTAVLGGTAASAAVSHAARPAATPGCSLSRLQVWIGLPGSGAAGSTAYPLEFSNISGGACYLFGYPGVSAIGRAGQQLGSAAGRDTTFRRHVVVLRRGWTAHAVLTITDAGNFPAPACRVRTATALKIFPPGDHRTAVIPLSFPACSKKGPSYLHIRVVRAGVGIPGVSQ